MTSSTGSGPAWLLPVTVRPPPCEHLVTLRLIRNIQAIPGLSGGSRDGRPSWISRRERAVRAEAA